MINKHSSTKEVVSYIGYHALAGFGLGVIEAILIGGMPSRQGKLRNIAIWSLVNMTSAATLAGLQTLMVKMSDDDIDMDWYNKFVTPIVFVVPLMFLNKARASMLTSRLFQVGPSAADTTVKEIAREALNSRNTIIAINNNAGVVPKQLGFKEKWKIGTFNYLYMVGITHLVDHFTG